MRNVKPTSSIALTTWIHTFGIARLLHNLQALFAMVVSSRFGTLIVSSQTQFLPRAVCIIAISTAIRQSVITIASFEKYTQPSGTRACGHNSIESVEFVDQWLDCLVDGSFR